MKKHILSYYAKREVDYQCSINSKKQKKPELLNKLIMILCSQRRKVQ